MRSREFFGNWKFKDINIDIYNENNELIFEAGHTTFANVNPIIKEEIEKAIQDYKNNWVQNGEPRKVVIFTTPSWKTCTYDVLTKKIEFEVN